MMKSALFLLILSILLVACDDKNNPLPETSSSVQEEAKQNPNENEVSVVITDKAMIEATSSKANFIAQFRIYNPLFNQTQIGDQVQFIEVTKITAAKGEVQINKKIIFETVIEITHDTNDEKIYRILVRELEHGENKNEKTYIKLCHRDDFFKQFKQGSTRIETVSTREAIVHFTESENALNKQIIELNNRVCLSGKMSSRLETTTPKGTHSILNYKTNFTYSMVDISTLDLEIL